MPTEEFSVWQWNDELGQPVYVGYGKHPMGSKVHPSALRFKARHDCESELNDYLCTLKKEPDHEESITRQKMYKEGAKAYVFALRRKLAKEGHTLLTTRPRGTTIGGGARRCVVDPNGTTFDSVRSAADFWGVAACTITRKCKAEKEGWRYVTVDD